MVNPVPIYNTLDNLEKLRAENEKRRDKALRRNRIATAAKGFAIYTAIPFVSGSVMLSGMESEYRNVTYKIPNILKKSKTLEKIGLKIAEGFYNAVDKTAEFLKKPKHQQLIEKTDAFVDNVATKVFKRDSDLKNVKGAMTTTAVFAAGMTLLGVTAIKHFVNRHKINKEYHKNQEQISKYQFRTVANQISKLSDWG